jgi:choice-of-anchor A domain-containing protein
MNGSVLDVNNLPPAGQVLIPALSNGANILHLSGINLNNIQSLTFSEKPSASKYLIINVDQAGAFSWNNCVFAGIGGEDAPYVLLNFYNATTVEMGNSQSVYASVFAPFASVWKNNSGNVDGQVIAVDFTMLQSGEIHNQIFLPDAPACCLLIVPSLQTK